MKRFLGIPMIMAIAGAISVILSFLEKLLPTALSIILTPVAMPMSLTEFFQFTLSEYGHLVTKGALIALSIGIMLAFWDALRNPQREFPLARLTANIIWCGLLGIVLGLSNSFLFFALTSLWTKNSIFPPDWFLILSYLAVSIPNFVAILWAATRSITTDDVLTPRVLRAKLRERARWN